MNSIRTHVTAAAAFALSAIYATAQPLSNPAVAAPLGPAHTAVALAPTLVSFEPAPAAEAAAEPGRLFHAAPLPDADAAGSTRVVRFSAPGAEAYRLYFEALALPAGARMFLYGLDAAGRLTATFGPYERSGPLVDGSFRSRVIPGVEAVLEIHGMPEPSGPWPMRIPWVASINAGLLAELRAAGDPSLTETAAQRAPARGEKIQVEYRGRMVTAEIIGGDIVVEGDIVIGSMPGGKTAGGPVFSLADSSSSAHWPGGVIPFVDSLPDNRGQVARDHWTQITNGTITFVPRTSEASFVRFIQPSADGCSASSIGRTSGVTTIKLGVSCSAGNARHEIGHALGFKHEQNRTDRDSFVRIFWSNLESVDFDDQFIKADGGNIGTYDFGSIMHYPLVVAGVTAMEPLVTVPAGVTIGQRTALSSGDLNAVNILYGVRVAPGTINVPAAGGTFSVSVLAVPDRFWVAKDTADWITMGPVLSGTGPGTVQFTVAPYTGTSVLSRTAKLNIALTPALNINASVSIVQSAPTCTFTVTPATIDATPEAGTYTVRLTTQPSCTWSASEALSWVTLSQTSGMGSANITVRTISGNFALNHKAPARRGSIAVAGRRVDVIQRGGCLNCLLD
ncbi:MAG: hypothetical protein IT162_07645 [Bryobacterales bacterium]|nr:hypothetical protein [Bryobacterales bacterium]